MKISDFQWLNIILYIFSHLVNFQVLKQTAYLLSRLFAPIKSALLFTLFARLWQAPLLLRICTSLAFVSYECSNDATIFTGCWLEKRKKYNKIQRIIIPIQLYHWKYLQSHRKLSVVKNSVLTFP